MDRNIKVDVEIKKKAIIFLSNQEEATVESINEAKKIKGEISKCISNQYSEFGSEFKEIYLNLKAKYDDYILFIKLREAYENFDKTIQRDLCADALYNKLHLYIEKNTCCNFCNDCCSLINVYLKIEANFNSKTIDEILEMRKKLCETTQKCNKPICNGKKILNFLDNDPVIKKKMGI